MKLFRKNKDLQRVAEHQRHLHALGNVVTTQPAPPPVVEAVPDIATVVSLAALRARKVGHPSAGGHSNAPVTARR